MKYYQYSGLLFLVFLNTTQLHAESFSCPLISEVKERTISQYFEWTVSDDTSLHSILNVNELLSVSIESYGEFLACTYMSETIQFRLDAKPLEDNCLLVPTSENWFSDGSGKSVCQDDEKGRCVFEINCQFQPQKGE